MAQLGSGECQVCSMPANFTHTPSQHAMAETLREPLLEHVRTDAFSYERERVLTYQGAVDKFRIATTARKVGRVLDAVECMLVAYGWPPSAAAGITAYVVQGQSGKPGVGWYEIWNMNPEDAREEARAYLRNLVLGDD